MTSELPEHKPLADIRLSTAHIAIGVSIAGFNLPASILRGRHGRHGSYSSCRLDKPKECLTCGTLTNHPKAFCSAACYKTYEEPKP